jgi:hypothetical protein
MVLKSQYYEHRQLSTETIYNSLFGDSGRITRRNADASMTVCGVQASHPPAMPASPIYLAKLAAGKRSTNPGLEELEWPC